MLALFINFSQDEKKRRQFGNRSERQKIVLEAVLDTTCKKCGGKGIVLVLSMLRNLFYEWHSIYI